jgi:hypothetical protein
MARPKKISEVPAVVDNSPLEVNDSLRDKIIGALLKADVSIDNYVAAIKDALSAEKTLIDKYGEEHTEPDHDKRLKAALIGLELEGYIKNKTVVNDNTKYTQVVYSWQPVKIINQKDGAKIPNGN